MRRLLPARATTPRRASVREVRHRRRVGVRGEPGGLHAAAASRAEPHGRRAVLRDLLDRVPGRRRLELFPQPHLDVPLDRTRRQRGGAVPERLGARADRRLDRLRDRRAVAGPRPQDVVRRDALRASSSTSSSTSIGRSGRSRERGERGFWLGGARVHGRSGRCCASRESTIRSSTTRAGVRATPPRSRATSRSCSTTSLFPQTDYDGPPPNYVELELQIVPFLAATLYKLFGVHEVFGRLISLAFGVATIPVIAVFGRWLFGSAVAGVAPRRRVRRAARRVVLQPHLHARHGDGVLHDRAPLCACARCFVDVGRTTGARVARLVAGRAAAGDGVLGQARRRGRSSIPVAACARRGARDARRAAASAAVGARRGRVRAAGAVRRVRLGARRVALGQRDHQAARAPVAGRGADLAARLRGEGASPSRTRSRCWRRRCSDRSAACSRCSASASRCARAATRCCGAGSAGGLLYAYVVVTVERVDYYLYLLLPLGRAGDRAAVRVRVRALGHAPQRRATLGRRSRPLVWLVGGRRGLPRDRAVLRVEPRQLRARQAARRDARARRARRDGALRSVDPLHDRAQGLGGRSAPVDAVRRAERDPQRRALLHLGRARARLKQTNLELYCWLVALSGARRGGGSGRSTRPIRRRCCPGPKSVGARSGAARWPVRSPNWRRGMEVSSGPVPLTLAEPRRHDELDRDLATLRAHARSVGPARVRRQERVSCARCARARSRSRDEWVELAAYAKGHRRNAAGGRRVVLRPVRAARRARPPERNARRRRARRATPPLPGCRAHARRAGRRGARDRRRLPGRRVRPGSAQRRARRSLDGAGRHAHRPARPHGVRFCAKPRVPAASRSCWAPATSRASRRSTC